MSENEYGNDFITLTDEEGNEIELEHMDTLEYEGELYMAFVPAYTPEDQLEEDAAELIILKSTEEDGEEILVTVDSDELLDKLFDLFVERLTDGEEAEDDREAFADDEE